MNEKQLASWLEINDEVFYLKNNAEYVLPNPDAPESPIRSFASLFEAIFISIILLFKNVNFYFKWLISK